MSYNYYIQVGTDSYKDLWTDYSIKVKEVEGLNETPNIKKPFSRSWPDEQGDDVYIPDTIRFETRDIKITFLSYGSSKSEMQSNINSFLTYLFSSPYFRYFDTYRNNGFHGYYDKSKINQEKYRLYQNYIEFEMTFNAPNGICYGFDNTANTSIYGYVSSGKADLYFSDGTSLINVDYNFIRDLNGGFVIVCPSEFRNVTIEGRSLKLFINDSVYQMFISQNDTLFIV